MRPLDGVKILDLSRLLPGPMCGWYLRGMGAQVIKIENPTGGDPMRHMPPLGPDGIGVWFAALNAGVTSVALDLRRPEGLSAAKALIASVDVVIEGFRPGVMARLGLDPEVLIAEQSRLIVASISGYGQTGSWRDRPGHDLGYMGLSGLLAMNGSEHGVPQPLSAQVADVGGGALTGALAIVGALLQREKTGEGAWLDVSMAEGALAFGLPWFSGAQHEGDSPSAKEHPLGGSLPQYRCYRCRDGEVITVAALEPKFLIGLCERLGQGIPSKADEWETLFLQRTQAEWLELLKGCCVGPVLDFLQAGRHPVHVERGTTVNLEGLARICPPVGSAHQFVQHPAPALGADTVRELAQVGIEWPTSGEVG